MIDDTKAGEERDLVAAIKGHNAAVDLHPKPYCRECHWQALKALEVIAALQARNAEMDASSNLHYQENLSEWVNKARDLEKRNRELEAQLKTSEEALASTHESLQREVITNHLLIHQLAAVTKEKEYCKTCDECCRHFKERS